MCELIEFCGFYWNYGHNPEVDSRGLAERFCHSDTGSISCARIQVLKNLLEAPPPNISPEGDAIAGYSASAVGLKVQG